MMTSDLKPYPAYKDSGVEWLGEVPVHWEVHRLKAFVANIVDQTSERNEHEIYLALENVESWTGRIRDSGSDVNFDSQVKRFQAGDVLFGKLRPYLAKVACLDQNGVCVGEFLVLRSYDSNLLPSYLEYLLRSKLIIDAIDASTFGTKMPRADWQFIGGMEQLFPPLPEQTAIVRFLDYADRRIRRYIRTKQKLIALLEEQKKSIIHQAVTGQIDVRTCQPYPAYKPTSVPWLGEVPVHWASQRLWTLADITTGGMDTIDRQEHGEYPFYVRSQTVERIHTWSFDGEAVLAAGDGVGVGKVFHYVNGKFDYHQRVYKFSGFNAVVGKFFFHYLKALLRYEVMRGTAKSTVDSLRRPMLRNFLILLPPITEQTAIVCSVEKIAVQIDKAVVRALREIDLLREYRTRLIADVVTGKLDVREAAAALPEVDPLATEDTLDDTLNTDPESDIDELDTTAEEVEA